MVSESAAGVDDLLQSAVDGRGAGSRRQSVDAADFEATHDCGEDLVLVHDVSFSCWRAVTHLASCLFSFLFTIIVPFICFAPIYHENRSFATKKDKPLQ